MVNKILTFAVISLSLHLFIDMFIFDLEADIGMYSLYGLEQGKWRQIYCWPLENRLTQTLSFVWLVNKIQT